MDLTSDHPFWKVKSGLVANYPPLGSDLRCDIAVLGAGITGALVAEALTADGHDVIVLDGRDAASGSTCASTALLQYEVDTHLVDLAAMHGPEAAALAYRACHESIDRIEELVLRLGLDDCSFTRKPSVYLASHKRDVPVLQREMEARRAIGIEVEFWDAPGIESRFDFSRPAALHSVQAAEVDAYRLTHGLLAEVLRRGSRVHDRTRVKRLDYDAAGVLLGTDRGFTVHAKRVVVAMGYETETLFDTAGLVNLNSSFAIASEPLGEVPGWWRRCLLWETARPYPYLRSDSDGRALIGGEDVPFRNAAARDRLVHRKCRKLEQQFREWFPNATMETAYSWAGTFGETADGLAYIGTFHRHPLCFFALGFGGNGVTYSKVAADILRETVRGKDHPYSRVFRFDR